VITALEMFLRLAGSLELANKFILFLFETLLRGRIQTVSLGGAISLIFGNQVSLPVHWCRRQEVYFTTLLRQKDGRTKWRKKLLS